MKKFFASLIVSAAAVGAMSAQAQDYTWSAGDDLTGWFGYINAFQNDCTTYAGYGYGYDIVDAGDGTQVAQLTAEGYLNVFSNYDDPNLSDTIPPRDGGVYPAAAACLETNVYREVIITAGDEGDYRLNLEPIPPALVGSDTKAFVKVLTMGYGATGLDAFALTPGNNSVVASISAADLAAGDLRVQFGFNTTAAGYANSGMTYDNIAFGKGLAAPSSGGSSAATDPTGIPVLPLWALFGLAGLIGLMGLRRKA